MREIQETSRKISKKCRKNRSHNGKDGLTLRYYNKDKCVLCYQEYTKNSRMLKAKEFKKDSIKSSHRNGLSYQGLTRSLWFNWEYLLK